MEETNRTGRNVLHLLVGSSSTTALAAARNLLESGRCKVDDLEEEGISPLHVACAWDNLAMCQLLLHFGADVLLEDENGRSPFSMATGNTLRFLVRLQSKNKKERRGTLRKLFICHSGSKEDVQNEGGGNLRKKMKAAKQRMRRSLEFVIGRRSSIEQDVIYPRADIEIPTGPVTSETVCIGSTSFRPPLVAPLITSAPIGPPPPYPTSSHDANRTNVTRRSRTPDVNVNRKNPTVASSKRRCRTPDTEKQQGIKNDGRIDIHNTPRRPRQTALRPPPRAIPSAPPITPEEKKTSKERRTTKKSPKRSADKLSDDDTSAVYLTAEDGEEDDSFDIQEMESRLRNMKISDEKSIAKNMAEMKRISGLRETQLRAELKNVGVIAGPICSRTRAMYEKKLLDAITRLKVDEVPKGYQYSHHLEKALKGEWNDEIGKKCHIKVRQEFANGGVTAFCYLLIDPRKLPEQPNLTSFVEAIFYVGKGTKARPYAHLIDARKERDINSPKLKTNVKFAQIDAIWNDGEGVVCLQVCQNISDEEAFVREAALIEAICIQNITNLKGGEWHGSSQSWSSSDRIHLGVYLIILSWGIFQLEGIRPIYPHSLPDSVYPFVTKRKNQ